MTDPINAGEVAEQAAEEIPSAGMAPVPVFGRPTIYQPEFCQRVVEFGHKGKSRAQIAALLGVAKATIQNWEAAHPEFLAAMSHARDLAQAWFEDRGQGGLFLPTKEFNAGLWAKQVSCRFREDYTERKELGGLDGSPLTVVVQKFSDAKPSG